MPKQRLLVVEDDQASRTVWETVFGQRGWEVILAGTVAEGLVALDPAPDYLILDLHLPDGNGETILRKIREGDLKTRVAVTTGLDDVDRLGQVHDLGPDALLEKPVNVVDVWREAGSMVSAGVGGSRSDPG